MLTIIIFALLFAAVFMFLAYKVFKAMRREVDTGKEGLTGEIGVAKTDIDANSGKVFVHGEWWNAVTAPGFAETIPAGSKIKVDSIEGFVLKVLPIGTISKGGG